jgi:hypothetical protein
MNNMKQKLLNTIDSFVNLCYTAFKIDAGNFAKNNFPKLVNNLWDESKSDEYNLKEIKDMFETNKKLNESVGNQAAAQVIDVFQKGWLNEIEV